MESVIKPIGDIWLSVLLGNSLTLDGQTFITPEFAYDNHIKIFPPETEVDTELRARLHTELDSAIDGVNAKQKRVGLLTEKEFEALMKSTETHHEN